jgi:hypothetical protein
MGIGHFMGLDLLFAENRPKDWDGCLKEIATLMTNGYGGVVN